VRGFARRWARVDRGIREEALRIATHSLRNKIVGVFLVPTLLIVVLYGALAYGALRQGLEDELGERLEAIGQTASAELSGGFEAKQIARLDESKKRVISRLRDKLERIRARTDARRVALLDRERRSLVDTREGVVFGEQLYRLEADKFEIERAFERGEATTSVLFTGEDGAYYKSAYVPVHSDGRPVAVLAVEASATYFDLLTDFASVLTALGAAGLVLVIIVGTLFARRITRPLGRLVEAAGRLGAGELDTQIVEADPERARRGDEIAMLAGAFEEMRGNILARDRQMQMMLSGIAHEVRNPLGGMELFCGLLSEDLRDEEPTDARASKLDKLERIQRELSYLDKVVGDFLDFARNRNVELERFTGREFAAEIEGLMAAQLSAGDCALTTRVDDGVELTADRERLHRAVINIVRNAFHACGSGGEVHLSIEEDDEESGQRVVRVADNGPGIPDEVLDDILTPFFTTKEKGSGLGLALTRQTVEQHGGEMLIDTEPGRGTTITLILPFDEELESTGSQIPEGWLG
jgi:signal transduction histidine kinase